MERYRFDRLYRDQQQVKPCAICAGLYPVTRKRLARELEAAPVCSDRCLGLYVARQVEEAKKAAEREQAEDIAAKDRQLVETK